MDPQREPDPGAIGERLERLPAIAAVRAALGSERAYLVGGAVRDLLLGVAHPDLDIAVEGDAAQLARRLGGALAEHERFATATAEVEGVRVDLATARSERYPRPGALPEIAPATIEADLARRDFTINAMAIPLAGAPRLLDPHGGLADLRERLLRVLHERSFEDDPTRALRAARYRARLELELEPRTAELIAAADLATVSADRVEAELRRLAAEPDPAPGFELLAELGLAGVEPGAGRRVAEALELLTRPGWGELLDRAGAVLAAARRDPAGDGAARELARERPGLPSLGVRLARGRAPQDLLVARLAGAAWLDEYVAAWRRVALEIGGEDLIAAGVPEGRAIGRGLSAALEAKLDGRARSRDEELRVALEAAAS